MQGQDAGAKIHEKVAGRGWMGRKSRPGGERLKTDLRNRREQIRRSDDQEIFPHLAKAAGQGRPVRCEIRLHAAVTVNGAGPGAERIQKAFRISLPPRSTLDEDIDRRDPGHRGTTPLDESAEDPVPKDSERRAGGGRRILGPEQGLPWRCAARCPCLRDPARVVFRDRRHLPLISSSISSIVRGTFAPRFSQPSGVTRQLSSTRKPMPHSSQ